MISTPIRCALCARADRPVTLSYQIIEAGEQGYVHRTIEVSCPLCGSHLGMPYWFPAQFIETVVVHLATTLNEILHPKKVADWLYGPLERVK